jgi:hypothetical protein
MQGNKNPVNHQEGGGVAPLMLGGGIPGDFNPSLMGGMPKNPMMMMNPAALPTQQMQGVHRNEH